MYLCGIPFNTVTLAALIVVLGMIVDNSIVVIDGYLDYLGRGYSRWYAAVESAREFFPSLLLATVCICMIFYPLLFTLSGMFRDFLNFFPWTVTINLMVSLLLAVLVIPFLEVLIIPVVQPRPEGKVSLTDRVQNLYRMLRADDRVKSVTSFVGCSSPRFQMSYAPQIAGKKLCAVYRQHRVDRGHGGNPRRVCRPLGRPFPRGLRQVQAAGLPECPLARVPLLRR